MENEPNIKKDGPEAQQFFELEKLKKEVESDLGTKPVIEATVGQYSLLRRDLRIETSFGPRKQSEAIGNAIKDVIVTQLKFDSKEKLSACLNVPGHEQEYIEALTKETLLRRAYSLPGCSYVSWGDWLAEYSSSGRFLSEHEQYMLEQHSDYQLIKDKIWLLKKHNYEIPDNETILASRHKLVELASPEFLKEVALISWLALQSNMRGEHIEDSPNELKNFVDTFSTAKHGLIDNLAFGIAAGYNWDNLYGTTV